jgi:hypothetical protein
VAEVHMEAQGARTAFNKAGFTAKAVFEDMVKDHSGKSGDLVVMVCDVQAYQRRG